jgi:hypothetical protein
MKLRQLRLGVLVGLVALWACSRTLSLMLPDSVPLRVYYLGETGGYVLSPGSEQYQKLKLWVDHNQSGWSQYLATTPSRGILITGDSLWLQFIGSSAITKTTDGVFTKSVAPRDYTFLRLSAETPNNRSRGP